MLCDALTITRGRPAHWVIFAGLAILAQPGRAAELPSATASSVARAIVVTEESTNLAVKSIGSGLFQLGLVRLDKNQRMISFPALVNMTEGNLEYLIVTVGGKTHESLLSTEAQPQDIHVAMLLIGAKGAGTNALPENPDKPLPGDKVEVQISWRSDDRTNHAPAEEFVLDISANAAMTRGPWIYNGSRLLDDGFAAQLNGSIVSLITDADALMNNPRRGREDDDNWKPRPAGLPPLKGQVEVSIRLSR